MFARESESWQLLRELGSTVINMCARVCDSTDVRSPFKELEWLDDGEGARLLRIPVDDLVDEEAEDLREMLEDEIEERLYDRY